MACIERVKSDTFWLAWKSPSVVRLEVTRSMSCGRSTVCSRATKRDCVRCDRTLCRRSRRVMPCAKCAGCVRSVRWFPVVAVTKCHPLDGRRQQCLSSRDSNNVVQEARTWKASAGRATRPAEGLAEDPSLLLSAPCSLASLGSWPLTQVSAPISAWPSLCAFQISSCFFSYEDTSH